MSTSNRLILTEVVKPKTERPSFDKWLKDHGVSDRAENNLKSRKTEAIVNFLFDSPDKATNFLNGMGLGLDEKYLNNQVVYPDDLNSHKYAIIITDNMLETLHKKYYHEHPCTPEELLEQLSLIQGRIDAHQLDPKIRISKERDYKKIYDLARNQSDGGWTFGKSIYNFIESLANYQVLHRYLITRQGVKFVSSKIDICKGIEAVNSGIVTLKFTNVEEKAKEFSIQSLKILKGENGLDAAVYMEAGKYKKHTAILKIWKENDKYFYTEFNAGKDSIWAARPFKENKEGKTSGVTFVESIKEIKPLEGEDIDEAVQRVLESEYKSTYYNLNEENRKEAGEAISECNKSVEKRLHASKEEEWVKGIPQLSGNCSIKSLIHAIGPPLSVDFFHYLKTSDDQLKLLVDRKNEIKEYLIEHYNLARYIELFKKLEDEPQSISATLREIKLELLDISDDDFDILARLEPDNMNKSIDLLMAQGEGPFFRKISEYERSKVIIEKDNFNFLMSYMEKLNTRLMIPSSHKSSLVNEAIHVLSKTDSKSNSGFLLFMRAMNKSKGNPSYQQFKTFFDSALQDSSVNFRNFMDGLSLTHLENNNPVSGLNYLQSSYPELFHELIKRAEGENFKILIEYISQTKNANNTSMLTDLLTSDRRFFVLLMDKIGDPKFEKFLIEKINGILTLDIREKFTQSSTPLSKKWDEKVEQYNNKAEESVIMNLFKSPYPPNTTLKDVVEDSPLDVADLIRENPILIDKIGAALVIKYKTQDTGLQKWLDQMYFYDNQKIVKELKGQFVNLIENSSKAIWPRLAEALMGSTKHGSILYFMVREKHKEGLNALINKMDFIPGNQIRDGIIGFLNSNFNGQTGLHLMARNMPSVLVDFMKKLDPDSKAALMPTIRMLVGAKILSQTVVDQFGDTPQILPSLFSPLGQNRAIMPHDSKMAESEAIEAKVKSQVETKQEPSILKLEIHTQLPLLPGRGSNIEAKQLEPRGTTAINPKHLPNVNVMPMLKSTQSTPQRDQVPNSPRGLITRTPWARLPVSPLGKQDQRVEEINLPHLIQASKK